MAKRLFKSSVPEETTNGVKHFKNRILAKFCAFFLAFTASSSAVVIAFQMASTAPVVAISKVQGLKDAVSSPVTNLLMNPTEDYDSGKNFLDEAAQSDGANGSLDNLSTTFTHHTTGDSDFSHTINWTSRWSPEMGSSSQMEVFSGNNAAPFSLDLTFELERYLGGSWYAVKQGHIAIQDIYDWTWSRPNIDWNLGGLSLDANELKQQHYRVSLNPAGVDTGYDADTQATRNNFRDRGQTPSGFWAMRDGNFSNSSTHVFAKTRNNADINPWSIISPTDFSTQLLGDIGNVANIQNVKLNHLQFHINFDADSDGHWSNSRTLYLNNMEVPTVYASYTAHSDAPLATNGWAVGKVFMNADQVAHPNLLTVQNLKDNITIFKDGVAIDRQKIIFKSNPILVPNANGGKPVIVVNLQIKTNDQDYYEPVTFMVPIHVVTFNDFIKISKFSSTEWNHDASGEVSYHQDKPSTKMMVNDKFIKTLQIITHKDELKTKFNSELTDWNLVNNDKNLVLQMIDQYAINWVNYDEVKAKYAASSKTSVLRNYVKPDYFDQIVAANKWNTLIPNYGDYLAAIHDATLAVKSQVDNGSTKLDAAQVSLGIADLADHNFQISDTFAHSNNQTSFAFEISEIKLQGYPLPSGLAYAPLAIWVDKDDLHTIYDLNVTQPQGETSIIHKYYYQSSAIAIASDISFVMEDGTTLDANLNVVTPSGLSSLKVGNTGYVKTRYLAHFVDHDEYVTLINQSSKWHSPKYNLDIDAIDKTFDAKNIQYVFNQEINLLINPYDLNGANLGPGIITSQTSIKYGINKVTDEFNGSSVILEDWNDGRWSHSHDVGTGHAVFDGIFGADVNGHLDKRGHLASGSHKISIDIQNSPAQLQTSYNLVIDKEPVKVEVKGVAGNVVHDLINVPNVNGTDAHDFYYASGAINFVIKDVDIDSASGELLASDGKWYSVPLDIRNIQENGAWKLSINSTIDYVGFARVKVVDQAGNVKEIYFKLDNSQSGKKPALQFDKNMLFSSEEPIIYNDSPLNILNGPSQAIIADPLVNNISIFKVDKLGVETIPIDDDTKLEPYTEPIPKDYAYGNTIDSSSQGLKYAGDELKPFLTTSTASWNVVNQVIDFKVPGLYKIEIQDKFIDGLKTVQYVYVKEDDLTLGKILDKDPDGGLESVNLDQLPNDKQEGQEEFKPTSEFAQNIYKTTPKIDYWPFLIKSTDFEFSYMWYSRFYKPETNDIDKEGKYSITVQTVFGDIINVKFLLLDKDISMEERTKSGSLIATDATKLDATAFWKGDVKWNVVAYEDKDHADYEWNKFLQDALSHGLTEDEAWKLYNQLKEDPNWDGNWNSIPENTMNQYIDDLKNIDPDNGTNFGDLGNSPSSLSSGSIAGIVVGSTIIVILSTAGITWLVIRTLRRRKIRH